MEDIYGYDKLKNMVEEHKHEEEYQKNKEKYLLIKDVQLTEVKEKEMEESKVKFLSTRVEEAIVMTLMGTIFAVGIFEVIAHPEWFQTTSQGYVGPPDFKEFIEQLIIDGKILVNNVSEFIEGMRK